MEDDCSKVPDVKFEDDVVSRGRIDTRTFFFFLQATGVDGLVGS